MDCKPFQGKATSFPDSINCGPRAEIEKYGHCFVECFKWLSFSLFFKFERSYLPFMCLQVSMKSFWAHNSPEEKANFQLNIIIQLLRCFGLSIYVVFFHSLSSQCFDMTRKYDFIIFNSCSCACVRAILKYLIEFCRCRRNPHKIYCM